MTAKLDEYDVVYQCAIGSASHGVVRKVRHLQDGRVSLSQPCVLFFLLILLVLLYFAQNARQFSIQPGPGMIMSQNVIWIAQTLFSH